MKNIEDFLSNFYRNNYDKAIRYANSLTGDMELAQDIASESILKLLEMKDQIDETKSIHYLFISIVRNKCFDHQRREQIRFKFLQNLIPEVEQGKYETDLHSKEINSLISRQLKKLPEKSKTIFLGIRIHGKSYKEMADELNISHRCVEYELNNTTGLIKKALVDFI